MLVPWRVERILHDGADFLVVDKPSGVVVHGGDEALADDLVHRLDAWLRSQGRGTYLGVHQRLDQATSGLLFFTRRKDVNGAVAAAMEAHRVRRTYLAVVALEGGDPTQGARSRGRRTFELRSRGRLEHQLSHARGRTEVVTRGSRGQRAVTEYEVLQRVGRRALVLLHPQTGRTHQLRVQLAAAGAPICGDRLYGGEPAPRLFLHATALGGDALGAEWTRDVPDHFHDWLTAGEMRVPADTTELLKDAGLRRFALRGETESYRLVNGAGDLLPGMVVDVYGEWAVLSLYDAELLARARTLAEQIAALGFRGVYLKKRVRADLRHEEAAALAPEGPLVGEPAPGDLVVTEAGLRVGVALADGLSTGLFVDQRDNRRRVRRLAQGGRMLNLFSYTCSFSVAAALGGASEVVSVDLSGRALERGRRNFELNGLDASAHRFFKEDAVKWLGRAARRKERFRVVVLDPPSFSTVGKGTFSVAKGYGEVAALALELLEPEGHLLAVTNHTRTSPDALRKILHRAAQQANRTFLSLRDAPSGVDCPEGAEGPWPSKSVWAKVR